MSDLVDPPAADGFRDLFARKPYLFFVAARFCGSLATSAQAVVIAWQVYEIARQRMSVEEAAFAVGMIGLVQFLPLFALSLVAGETADRYDRRRILIVCLAGQILVSLALTADFPSGRELWPVFLLAAVFGCTRAFFHPAASAMLPMLAPPHLLPRAIASNTVLVQTAMTLGPTVGGFLCAVSPSTAYAVCAGLYTLSGVCVLLTQVDARPRIEPGRSRFGQIVEGVRYLWKNKLVLGAISLDLFAVLLGGATGLLPVFARDVLHVGPEGFGILRAAPPAGAILVGVYLAFRPLRRRVGVTMFLAVGLFGLMTVVFAYSESFPLSVAALAVLGGADMVSVFTRQSLVQLSTPDRMRGRVSAVSTLFIGASNELGEFESGVAARFLGPVGAVAFGGFGAMAVTALWARLFPALRTADKLE